MSPFFEGRAIIRSTLDNYEGKYGFIDNTVKIIVDMIYDFARLFENGVTQVEKDGKRGVIDKEGNLVLDIEYNWIHSFRNGKKEITIAIYEKRWHFIFSSGKKYPAIFFDTTDKFVI